VVEPIHTVGGVFILRAISDEAESLPSGSGGVHRARLNSRDDELIRFGPRRIPRTAEYDILAAYSRVHFCYGHTLGRFDYLALRPVHAALSTVVHSSELTPNRRSLFPAAIPTYTLDYRNGDSLIRYRTEFA
jgi:hypothetical protein